MKFDFQAITVAAFLGINAAARAAERKRDHMARAQAKRARRAERNRFNFMAMRLGQIDSLRDFQKYGARRPPTSRGYNHSGWVRTGPGRQAFKRAA